MNATKMSEPLANDATVLVVGASLAGMRSSETLRAEGFAGRIILVGEEAHLPYDRPPLSKQVLAGEWEPERVFLADQEKLEALGLELIAGHRAISFDAEALKVGLDDGTTLAGDAVIVATGARARHLPGTEGSEHVMVVRTLDDSIRLRQRITGAEPGYRVVVVGAGFIGAEVASTCQKLGCQVTVIEQLQVPLSPILGAVMGAACSALHDDAGVELRTGIGVVAVHPAHKTPQSSHDGVVLEEGVAGRVELSDGSSVPADLIVVGIGVIPAVEWLVDSGVELDAGVVVDSTLFAADRVAAAGDLARWPFGAELLRIEHWQIAVDMAALGARNLLAGRAEAKSFHTVPYFWSDQYGVRIQMLGHPDPEDEVQVVDGSTESHKFVALYGRDGRLTAALGISRPKQLMSFRRLLSAGASWDEALALELS